MTDLAIHHCQAISIGNHMPENSNSLTLKIQHEAYGMDRSDHYRSVQATTEITLFGLPAEVTDALIEALAKVNAAKPAETEAA